MGRLASKRKLKACDPFFKGTRDSGKKKGAGGGKDLPPTESKRSKKRKRKAADVSSIEQFVVNSSVVDSSDPGAKKKSKFSSIKPNESIRQFNKRLNAEVRQVVTQEAKKSKKSSEKRKAFLNKRKEKKKEKKMTDQERYEKEFQQTGSRKKDKFDGAENVRFNERVDAPPILPKLKGTFRK